MLAKQPELVALVISHSDFQTFKARDLYSAVTSNNSRGLEMTQCRSEYNTETAVYFKDFKAKLYDGVVVNQLL